ncbi:hypothetical protein [Nostoc linckia]|uniref:hypothetical protein n=1 Tax=Nostoc linckia TaxID=92942 RepID=UPI0015D4BB52|nr:hypothetical protein [Nostoc linckia]
MGRWGDREIGRWGDGEMGIKRITFNSSVSIQQSTVCIPNAQCPMPNAQCPMFKNSEGGEH